MQQGSRDDSSDSQWPPLGVVKDYGPKRRLLWPAHPKLRWRYRQEAEPIPLSGNSFPFLLPGGVVLCTLSREAGFVAVIERQHAGHAFTFKRRPTVA